MKKGVYDDLTNKRFGKLTVLSFNSHGNRRRIYWNCLCDCGKEAIVESSHLKSGHTKSCGCVSIERIRKVKYKNGLSNTRIWRTYWNMINRCYNKNIPIYKHYGMRGIKVCNEWLDKNNGFVNFCNWALSNGYSDELTLDRIDNNGNYSQDNCRFVEFIIQANNKRNNVIIEIDGKIGPIASLSRELKLNYLSLYQAIRRNQDKYKGHKICRIG